MSCTRGCSKQLMRPQGSPKELGTAPATGLGAAWNKGCATGDRRPALPEAVDRRSVRRWKAHVGRHGPDALAARRAPGPVHPNCRHHNAAAWSRHSWPRRKPPGLTTTCGPVSRVAQLIRQRFEIGYHVDHLGRLLRSGWGWSPQRPERRARERDEVQTGRWIKEQWPRIKKSPPVEAPHWSLLMRAACCCPPICGAPGIRVVRRRSSGSALRHHRKYPSVISLFSPW